MKKTDKPWALSLAFILELAMLAAFAVWGASVGSTPLTRILLAVGAPLLAAVVWGLLLAPKSPRRLRGLYYVALKIVLFGLAALGLIAAGQTAAGIVLAAVFLISLRWAG